MPRKPTGRPRGRPRKTVQDAPESPRTGNVPPGIELPETPTTEPTKSTVDFAVGNLSGLLRPYQIPVYNYIKNSANDEVVVASHRGSGKSFTGCLLAVEKALSTPNIGVRVFCSTAKMAREIIRPLLQQVLAECPDSLKPKFSVLDGLYSFKNGSTIALRGADLQQEDSSRGVSYPFTILDEAGFMKSAGYLYESVILPRMAFEKGKLIWLSTPPVSPAHFYADRMRRAQEDGNLFTFKITDNPFFSEEDVDRYAKKLGGRGSTAFRREMMCEIVTEEKYALVPDIASGRVKLPSVGVPPVKTSDDTFTAVFVDFVSTSAALLCRVTDDGYLCIDDCIDDTQSNARTLLSRISSREVASYGRPNSVRISNLNRNNATSIVAATGEPLFHQDASFDVAGPGALRSLVHDGRVLFAEKAQKALEEISNAVYDEHLAKIDEVRPGYRFHIAQAMILAALHTPNLHITSRETLADLQTLAGDLYEHKEYY